MGRGWAARLATLLGALAIVAASLAPASPASTWAVSRLGDTDGVQGILFGVSCPSTRLCVATGSGNLVATSTDPAGGAAAWRTFHPGGPTEIPFGGAGAMAEAPATKSEAFSPSEQIRGVSCPSAALCVGASFQGRMVTSTDPTGGAGAWRVVLLGPENAPHAHMTGVSCPSTSLCVGVAYAGKIATSIEPAGDAGAWSLTQLPQPTDLTGVSCATPSLCVAVGNDGSVLVSTEPAGGAATWHLLGAPAGAAPLGGVSCPVPALCVTANPGQILTSTDPGGGAWRVLDAGTGLPVKGVSCPTASACAAVDNNADVIVSTDPTGGPGAWSFQNVISVPAGQESGNFNGMFGISCPTTGLCVAVGQREQVMVSTDPFAAPKRPVVARASKRRPRVVITHHPAKRTDSQRGGVRVGFRFHAVGRAKGFRCRLRGRRFGACSSPTRYRLGRGRYAFKVRAIGPTGARGPVTTFHFRVGALEQRPPVGSCPPDQPGNGHPCIPSG